VLCFKSVESTCTSKLAAVNSKTFLMDLRA